MRSKRTTNRQLPHLWASGNVPRAHNSTQSFWFEGDTIYSYRQPIGLKTNVHPPDNYTQRVALLSSIYWSVTTSHHQNMTRYALDDARWIKFTVPRLDVNLKSRSDTNGAHAANADYLYDQYANVKRKIRTGHVAYAWRADALEETLATYNNYVRIFLRRRPLKVITEDEQEMIAAYRERIAQQDAIWEERHRKRTEQLIREAQEDLQKWLAGEDVRRFFPSEMGVYLRLTQHEDIMWVETTMGARVPETHAKRVWKFINELKSKGETYQHNGHKVPIGDFTVDSIDADYTLHAGCHHIPYERMQEFALKYWKED